MQLAIDTSTGSAGIALSQKGEVVAELTWHCEQNHTIELLPNLIRLFHQAQVSLQSIGGIVVARGPGNYSGLRVGMSVAKGIVVALGIPLVGISTLEAEAYPHASTGLPLCPVHNIGRGEIAAAFYQRKRGAWRCLQPEYITTLDTLCSQIKTKTLFCGELSLTLQTQLKEGLEELAEIPEPAGLERVVYLARLGWQRLNKGDTDDPIALQPLYLRKPAITQPKSRNLPRWI